MLELAISIQPGMTTPSTQAPAARLAVRKFRIAAVVGFVNGLLMNHARSKIPMLSVTSPSIMTYAVIGERGQYAQGASMQGATGLEDLAGTGTGGKHAGNLFRDQKKVFGFPKGCAPIDWIPLPTKAGRKTPHPAMYPHRFFMELFQHRPALWRERIEGVEGGGHARGWGRI